MFALRFLLVFAVLVVLVLLMLQRGVQFPTPILYFLEVFMVRLGRLFLPQSVSVGIVDNRLSIFSSEYDEGGKERKSVEMDAIIEMNEK
jgi:hypothetical protein